MACAFRAAVVDTPGCCADGRDYNIHHTKIAAWKRQGDQPAGVEKLHTKIGQLVVEPYSSRSFRSMSLTALGQSLGEAFCGVWHWAEAHLCEVEAARTAFDRSGEDTSELQAL